MILMLFDKNQIIWLLDRRSNSSDFEKYELYKILERKYGDHRFMNFFCTSVN